MKRRGFLVVLSGPSGAGKNTLLNAVLPRIPDLKYSVSATTRPPRPGERDGVDYFFLDDAAFDAMIARDEFLEWAEFAGYRYGTPRRFVEECLAQGYGGDHRRRHPGRVADQREDAGRRVRVPLAPFDGGTAAAAGKAGGRRAPKRSAGGSRSRLKKWQQS